MTCVEEELGLFIQTFGTFTFNTAVITAWLSSAIDTSARARHYFQHLKGVLPSLISFNAFSASFNVDTTRTTSFVPFKSSSTSLERFSVPLSGLKSTSFKGSPVANSYAVLTAASATPPEAQKLFRHLCILRTENHDPPVQAH